jgi:hypothetical protein
MKKIISTLMAVLMLVSAAAAQDTSGPKKEKGAGGQKRDVTSKPKNTEVSEAKPASAGDPEPASGEGKRWAFYLTFSGVTDSNINHDLNDLDDVGMVAGAGVYFRNRPERPTFEFNYEVGRHAYKNTDRWDRTSHILRVNSERRLRRWLTSDTAGEISLKGSTEDRELADRYTMSQDFQFRFSSRYRFNAGAAYRIKRYDDDPGRNAINPYFEGGPELRFNKARTKVAASYRYETNRTWNQRFRYIRWTYGVELATPLAKKDRLAVELLYRPQKYARLIEIERPGPDLIAPRFDRRWILSAEWKRPVWRDLELGLVYKYETRNSNDPDRNFDAHAAGATFTYRWWR